MLKSSDAACDRSLWRPVRSDVAQPFLQGARETQVADTPEVYLCKHDEQTCIGQ